MSDAGLIELPWPENDRAYPARGIHAKVITTVGQDVVAGRLLPGETLPREAELIHRFGVSRTAIREALKVLAAKGLVETRQKTGTRVRPRDQWNLLDPDVLGWLATSKLDDAFINDLIELRQVVEPAAARFAAARATPSDIAALEAAFDHMARNVTNEAEYYRADLAFHAAIFSASHNQLIDRLGSTVRTILEVSFRLQRRSLIAPQEGLNVHEAVLDHIRRGDPAAADAAMHDIIDKARMELERAKQRAEAAR